MHLVNVGLINNIYTHNEAAQIIEIFESVLNYYNIKVPSPEDDEREPDNEAALYGSVYYDLLDDVENHLIDLLNRKDNLSKVITGKFSGI